MTPAEFVALVKQMRLIQRRYFKERRPADVATSIALERQVDKAIERFEAPPTLFDREPAA